MEKYFIALVPDNDMSTNEILTKTYNAESINWMTKEQARYYAD
jgi:hypothetical protein